MYATHYTSSRFSSTFFTISGVHIQMYVWILLFLACFDEPNDDDLLFWIFMAHCYYNFFFCDMLNGVDEYVDLWTIK